MRSPFATLHLLVRGLLLLSLAWGAVVVLSTLVTDHRFGAGTPACAELESAHAARDGAGDGDWTVRARYHWVAGGQRRTGTQVWAWGQEHRSDVVHEAAQAMRQQQREQGCVRIVVHPTEPDRAIVFRAPLRAFMQHEMATVAPIFLGLLALELALLLWASWREQRRGAAAHGAFPT